MSSEVPIPEEAIEAATQALKVSEAPDVAADAESWFRAHAEATVRAAAPLILAADLDAQAEALDQQASALGSPRHDTSASGMVVILRDLAEEGGLWFAAQMTASSNRSSS